MKKNGRIIGLLVLAFASVVPATGASAHTVLVSANLDVGQSYKSLPDSITLQFADNLLNISGKLLNTVTVTDPMKQQIASHSTTSGNKLIATLNESMKMNGNFQVSYRVVAQDGHVVQGEYSFNITSDPAVSRSKVSIRTSGTLSLTVAADGKNAYLHGDLQGSATGKVFIDFGKKLLCYQISVKNLSDLTGAHIHAVVKSGKTLKVRDEVYIPLNLKSVELGQYTCTSTQSLSLTEIANDPSHYFLMIHTGKFPDGAIGGVLKSQ